MGRGDGDDPVNTIRRQLTESQRNHATIRTTDRSIQRRDLMRIENIDDPLRLGSGCRVRGGQPAGALDSISGCVDRRGGANDIWPPAEVGVGTDAAQHQKGGGTQRSGKANSRRCAGCAIGVYGMDGSVHFCLR